MVSTDIGGGGAGRMPALRVPRMAGGPVELHRAKGAGGSRGSGLRRLGPAGRPALRGRAGAGPGQAGWERWVGWSRMSEGSSERVTFLR
jgi:hypothetical protein